MAFTFNLETTDGTPAEPPSFQAVARTWRPGGTIPIRIDRALRVVGVRATDIETPVLIVEDVSE